MMVTIMITKPMLATSHICQIRPKPTSADSAAITKPAQVFFGMWIFVKPDVGRW
ncbi:hypothetical protein D3C87_1020310 [compost metagenome]